MDCSLPGSSVHGIFQAIVLEWIAISFSRGSSRPRDRTRVSCIVDRRFTVWATREVYIYNSLIHAIYQYIPGTGRKNTDKGISKSVTVSVLMWITGWLKIKIVQEKFTHSVFCNSINWGRKGKLRLVWKRRGLPGENFLLLLIQYLS